MERVSLVHGKNPVLLVAPHGFDDSHTATLTEAAAIACNGNAVINRGWERADTVNVLTDKANCNNIKHANHNVVKDEFLDPVNRLASRIATKHRYALILHIHGCGNDIRKKCGEDVDVIIGWGDGNPKRPTSSNQTRNLFTYLCDMAKWMPVQAGTGSKFAAWDRNNLLQLWNNHYIYQALQLEFVTATRRNAQVAEATGQKLGNLINTFLSNRNYAIPSGYSYLRLNL
jgi:hypothetical protein